MKNIIQGYNKFGILLSIFMIILKWKKSWIRTDKTIGGCRLILTMFIEFTVKSCVQTFMHTKFIITILHKGTTGMETRKFPAKPWSYIYRCLKFLGKEGCGIFFKTFYKRLPYNKRHKSCWEAWFSLILMIYPDQAPIKSLTTVL